MTEAEWMNECLNPQGMVWVLDGMKVSRTKVGKRKLRLFACACCRLFWHILNEPILRNCVAVAEQFAEAQTSKQELQKAYERAREFERQTRIPNALERTATYLTVHAAQPNAFSAAFDMTICEHMLKKRPASALCGLLRDIFSNTFHPVTVTRNWLAPIVKQLATAIYEDRDFDRLPILADALEDAGCNQPDILSHLRSGGDHCRGCWALDLVLAKE